MKLYFKLILTSYILFILNLIASNSSIFSLNILLIINFLLLIIKRLNQRTINIIAFIQILILTVNSYFILITNFSEWFLLLNNLLWLLTSIKVIEVKNKFNIKNVILFIFVSLGTSTLFNESILFNIISLLSIFILFYSLLIFNSYKVQNFLKNLFVLISFIPLSLGIYIILPKTKPWLNLQSNRNIQTGITNTLKPGDISSIVLNEELVARVSFEDQIPAEKNRYWRVHVLDKIENNTWKQSENYNYYENNFKYPQKSYLRTSKKENWILEPNRNKNIPWSGIGITDDPRLKISSKGIIYSEDLIKVRTRYSIKDSKYSWRKNKPLTSDLIIEKSKNKKLNKLGEKWFKESKNSSQILSKAENWFKNNNFKYTLYPGKMSEINPYDDFLFRKKSGFCEHFAGSFSLLMRSANIPSRVVVGYQGGEIIRQSKNKAYLLIDNSFTHAWSEIWIEEKGWIRIDPTSWISPERIIRGTIINKNPNYLNRFNKTLKFNLQNSLIDIDLSFKKFIDKFTPLLKSYNLSKDKIIDRLLKIFIIFIVLLVSIIFILIPEKVKKISLIKLSIYLYLSSLNKLNIQPDKGDTFLEFSNKIGILFPDIFIFSVKISNIYNDHIFMRKSFKNNSIKLLELLKAELIVLNHIASKKIKYLIKSPLKNR